MAERDRRYLLWHAEVDAVVRELQEHVARRPQQAPAVRAAVVDLSAARAAQPARRPDDSAFRNTPPPASAAAFAEAVRRTRQSPRAST